MKRLLVIPLVLLILRRVDSQNMDTGNALPCGTDNLSCINFVDPDDSSDCLILSQLCDGTNDCAGGTPDEGVQFATLDCAGTPMSFRCTDGQIITLNLLCDGMNDCESGEDERSLLCENKCRLPYYGDCTFTRECVSTEFGQNCGACLPGFTPDPGDPFSGPCLPLCPDPADIENGMVTFTGNSVGDTANYSCDSGFELIGAATLTCTQLDVTASEFLPAAPVCSLPCPDPPALVNGVVTFTGNSVGDTANYSCDSGFELIGAATLTCTQVNVTASAFLPAAPVCSPLCPDPADIENGMVTFTDNSVGYTANYSCNSGFELIGAATLTCTQVNVTASAFLPAAPVCSPLCPDPADIENGVVTFTGNSVGYTANYSCNPGFELIGAATLTCTQVNVTASAFLPAAPVCSPLCPDPADIENGVVTFTGNSVGYTANYSCNPGFELIGAATLTCTQVNVTASAFLPAAPVCRQPLCPDPADIENGMVTSTGISIGDTATYSCNSGFELIGAATLTCTQVNVNTAAFLPAAPVCSLMCPDPADIMNGRCTANGNSVGDTAICTCDKYFELVGSAILTCTEVNMTAAAFLPASVPPVCRLITRGEGCIADGGICDPHFPTSCCSWKCPFGTSRCEPGENGCVFAGGKCHSDFNCCSFQCIRAPGARSGVCEDGRNRCVYGGGGGLCNRDNDCCSEDCVGNICAAPGGQNGCTVGGDGCFNDRDCCSRECLASGLCEAGENGCVFGGGSCRRDHNCCSGKCTNGSCEPGQNGCVNPGGRCDCFLDCCSRLCSHFGGCIDA